MRIGLLRERIWLQRLTETQDSSGDPVASWANVDTYGDGSIAAQAVSVRMKTKEDPLASTIVAETRMDFVIRYRTDLDTTDRISWADRNWNILGVIRDEAREWVRLITSEVVRGVETYRGRGDAELQSLGASGSGTVT